MEAHQRITVHYLRFLTGTKQGILTQMAAIDLRDFFFPQGHFTFTYL